MENRRFGRTNHFSTVAIFGGAAFWEIEQDEADRVMELVMASGVNHIDVAPSYGQAETRIGRWMKTERERFFLGCKTMERTRQGAWRELHESLERLQTDHFDLYQCHAVTSMDELDSLFVKGGAMEALLEARTQGLTQHLGITGHGADTPAIFLEALRRFNFDSVLFPLNYVQMGIPTFREHARELIRVCREKDAGTMIIKSITKGPWGDKKQTATTWYEPFDRMEEVQEAVNYVLSQDVTGICTAGDIRILPLVLKACDNFTRLNEAEQNKLLEHGTRLEPLFK